GYKAVVQGAASAIGLIGQFTTATAAGDIDPCISAAGPRVEQIVLAVAVDIHRLEAIGGVREVTDEAVGRCVDNAIGDICLRCFYDVTNETGRATTRTVKENNVKPITVDVERYQDIASISRNISQEAILHIAGVIQSEIVQRTIAIGAGAI